MSNIVGNTLPVKKTLICYCDGSCKPQQGLSGFGIFGYTFLQDAGTRSYKMPGNNKYFLTQTGIEDSKNSNLTVQDIYEHIEYIQGSGNTNNHAELMAVIRALHMALKEDDIQKVMIITDSAYVVNCYNESLPKWAENGWKKVDNRDIIHIKEWSEMSGLAGTLHSKGVMLEISWVKSHSDNYGNYLADLFSTVGSNCAVLNLTHPIENKVILSQKISYIDYCKSYESKDVIYNFKELYFNSSNLDDSMYCFLYNTDDLNNNVGRKNTESLFALNVGYVPRVIRRLKEIHRSTPRNYITTCSIKLNKLSNKEVFRLFNTVDPHYMISRQHDGFYLIRDNTPFMYDVKFNVPLIMNVNNVFNKLQFTFDKISEGLTYGIYPVDITTLIVQNGKIAFTNQVSSIKLNEVISENTKLSFMFKQSVYLNVGYDIPSYLVLKGIESQIEQVLLYVGVDVENTLATVYCKLILDNRELFVTNILNKFSVRFLDL